MAMTDYEKRKKEIRDEYKAIFANFHQPSGKEAKRITEIVAEYMDLIREENREAKAGK